MLCGGETMQGWGQKLGGQVGLVISLVIQMEEKG